MTGKGPYDGWDTPEPPHNSYKHLDGIKTYNPRILKCPYCGFLTARPMCGNCDGDFSTVVCGYGARDKKGSCCKQYNNPYYDWKSVADYFEYIANKIRINHIEDK